jgi:hypothetical protein
MPESALQQIETDIAEAERLMTELRLRIAVSQSVGEETTDSERRLQDILKGWMLLQDQRQKAIEAEFGSVELPAGAERHVSAPDLR